MTVYSLLLIFSLPMIACQLVEGDRILGKHLAAADARFAALDPQRAFGFAPMIGAVRTMALVELAGIARRAGMEPPPNNQSVCFELETVPLEKEQLQAAIDIAFGAVGAEVLEYSPGNFPRGRLEFTRAGLELSGHWRGRIAYGSRSAPVWVRVHIAKTSEGTVPDAMPVQRGDEISVEVRSGPARLRFDGRAESAGRAGDSILVRNPLSGKLFQAKVLSKGKATIDR